MAVLLCFSAFFSASEAALFYLHRRERRTFRKGNRAQRAAAALLDEPDRLLTAVLFWNLVTNLAYFTLASSGAIDLERGGASNWTVGAWTVGALLAIIFGGEMLPKTLAVMQTRLVAALVALPLTVAVRSLNRVLPILKGANALSLRLLWPSFQPEPYLEVADLERAVAMSTTDTSVLEQEETVLQNILSLSDYRVDELMRPRNQVRTFRPPVAFADLANDIPRSGYVLITEADSDEIAAAFGILRRWDIPKTHLEHLAEPVAYVPWSARVSTVWQTLTTEKRRVAVVLNEFGETIGVVTYEDILDSIFTRTASRSARLLNRQSIRLVRRGVWHVTGMTSLRRVARMFDMPFKPRRTVTVAGLLHEQLERLPEENDEIIWEGLRLRVMECPGESLFRGSLIIELTRATVDKLEDSQRPRSEARIESPLESPLDVPLEAPPTAPSTSEDAK